MTRPVAQRYCTGGPECWYCTGGPECCCCTSCLMLSQKHSKVYFCTSTVNDLCVLNLVGWIMAMDDTLQTSVRR